MEDQALPDISRYQACIIYDKNARPVSSTVNWNTTTLSPLTSVQTKKTMGTEGPHFLHQIQPALSRHTSVNTSTLCGHRRALTFPRDPAGTARRRARPGRATAPHWDSADRSPATRLSATASDERRKRRTVSGGCFPLLHVSEQPHCRHRDQAARHIQFQVFRP